MKTHECGHEQDTLDAVVSRRWPGRDDDVSAHIASCGICADLAAVAAALRDDWDRATDLPPLPAADVVWWRAQVRARTDAVRLAARPIAVLQGVSAATAAGVALTLTTFAKAPVTDTARWFTSELWSWIPRLALSPEAASLVFPAVILGVGVWLALVPVAVFLASDD